MFSGTISRFVKIVSRSKVVFFLKVEDSAGAERLCASAVIFRTRTLAGMNAVVGVLSDIA